MADRYFIESLTDLVIIEKYNNELYMEGFLRMMKDPSYCYKFYWLEAIVKLISEGVRATTFDEVITEMICNAWYSVREFHIHLSGLQADGQVRDGLERAVLKLSELSELAANASRIEIRNAIKEWASELKPMKEQLTNMVPYRALSGFFLKDNSKVDWNSVRRLTEYIEGVNRNVVSLPYILGPSSKLEKEIYFQPAWIEMIQDNTVSILGWIQYEKLHWLQNNNPEVPGLIFKLAPMDEKMRKLKRVHELWDAVIDLHPITDVFTGKQMMRSNYDVDHFIPWSFVMNDELWNLMPMDSSLNSSKSNRLPKWDPFFERFANNQFLLYNMIHDDSKPQIHKMYENCFKDNLHSIWAGQELYRKGNSRDEFCQILDKNMHPIYDSAKRQGYEIWNFETAG